MKASEGARSRMSYGRSGSTNLNEDGRERSRRTRMSNDGVRYRVVE